MINSLTTSCSVPCSLAYLRGFWPPGRRFLQVDCWHNSFFHDGWIPGELLAVEASRRRLLIHITLCCIRFAHVAATSIDRPAFPLPCPLQPSHSNGCRNYDPCRHQ